MKKRFIPLACYALCLFTLSSGCAQKVLTLFPQQVNYVKKGESKITAEAFKNKIIIYDQNVQGKSIATLAAGGRPLPGPPLPCLPERCQDLILRVVNKEKYELLIPQFKTSITLHPISISADFQQQLAANGNQLFFIEVLQK